MALLKDLIVFGATNLNSDTFANHIYSNGFHHNSVNSDSYILLAGGGYKLESNLSPTNANQLVLERPSDMHSTTIGRMFASANSTPSNGPITGDWIQGLTLAPNCDTNYKNLLVFAGSNRNNRMWTQCAAGNSWGKWREILTCEYSTDSNGSIYNDCNNVDRTGIWTSDGLSHRPGVVLNWGSLFNIRLYQNNNNYHRQLFFDCYGSDLIWTRSRYENGWTDWREVITSKTYKSTFWTTGSTSWIKININSTASWMLSFVVRVYQSYTHYDIVFQGYNYGSNYWYSPQATLRSSSTTSITVYFGYDSINHLWVGISGGNYTGVEIIECCNGYNQTGGTSISGNGNQQALTPGNLFTISNVSSLGGTIQSQQTIYRPWLRNETVSNADMVDGYHANDLRIPVIDLRICS